MLVVPVRVLVRTVVRGVAVVPGAAPVLGVLAVVDVPVPGDVVPAVVVHVLVVRGPPFAVVGAARVVQLAAHVPSVLGVGAVPVAAAVVAMLQVLEAPQPPRLVQPVGLVASAKVLGLAQPRAVRVLRVVPSPLGVVVRVQPTPPVGMRVVRPVPVRMQDPVLVADLAQVLGKRALPVVRHRAALLGGGARRRSGLCGARAALLRVLARLGLLLAIALVLDLLGRDLAAAGLPAEVG